MKRIMTRTLAAVAALAALAATGTEIAVDAAKPLNVSKGGDDVAQLKRLALNVGSEFGTNRVTDAYLQSLNIRTIRLINVSISGRFDDQGNYVDLKPSSRLEADLALCKRLDANPHIIISGLPEQLLKTVTLKVTRHRALGIDLKHKRQTIGPTDYKLLENWYLAYFEHIKIQRGFKEAVFEIFNEPDLGTLIYPNDDIPPKGSEASYACMLKIYRAASAAAKRFDLKYPDCRITIGGPGITLAFTYRQPGNQGWAKRFIIDCALEKLKLDFLGLHHYASVAPFRGAPRSGLTAYPSLPDMLAGVQTVIDEHSPGLPIWLTEYGAHHNVVGEVGEINGSHDGAAFSLDCLNSMLEQGIDFAIYLVTTDQARRNPKTKKPYNLYSWCSFLTSPAFHGYPYPKAPFHAYKMVSELTGKRVAASASGGNTRVFAATDPTTQTLRVLLWNFATYIPEVKSPIEEGKTESIRLTISNAALPANAKAVLRMVDKNHGDVFSADREKRPVNLVAAMPKVATLPIRRKRKTLDFDLVMQPGSIAMIEIGKNPVVPSIKTTYSEQAEILLKTMRDKKPLKTVETGKQLLKLADAHLEQKIDALTLMTVAANQAKKTNLANTFALEADALCKELKASPPFAIARQLGDSKRAKKEFAVAIDYYRQALEATDCDWRARFGTELTLIDCLNSQRKFAEVIDFCDSVIARKDDDGHPELKGDFRLRKLEALRNSGQFTQMFAVYKELLESDAKVNAKLGGVIAIVVHYRSQKELDKALAEGKIGLALEKTHPGLLGRLKGILKQIEQAKQK
jgi:tetratricopeptide (TPR) repeat protein